jgi:hypothetical protein
LIGEIINDSNDSIVESIVKLVFSLESFLRNILFSNFNILIVEEGCDLKGKAITVLYGFSILSLNLSFNWFGFYGISGAYTFASFSVYIIYGFYLSKNTKENVNFNND